MVIKDYRWIGLEYGDTLINTPSVCNSITMTLMYVPFIVRIIKALSY